MIIDEAQDFKEIFWYTLNEIIHKDSYFYIFTDPQQNIYSKNQKLPDFGEPFLLTINCRNTKSIYNKVKPFIKDSSIIHENAPLGAEVEEFSSPTPALRRNFVSKTLHHLIEEQKVKEQDIVILGAHSISKTCLADNLDIGKFKIVENGSSSGHSVPYYTFMKYKGCESSVVILLDVDPEDTRWKFESAMYTAITRAKNMLYLINVK